MVKTLIIELEGFEQKALLFAKPLLPQWQAPQSHIIDQGSIPAPHIGSTTPRLVIQSSRKKPSPPSPLMVIYYSAE